MMRVRAGWHRGRSWVGWFLFYLGWCLFLFLLVLATFDRWDGFCKLFLLWGEHGFRGRDLYGEYTLKVWVYYVVGNLVLF